MAKQQSLTKWRKSVLTEDDTGYSWLLVDWLVKWLPGGVGGLHLVWVPAVGPEEEQPVEQWGDVGHVGLPLRKDPEDAAVLLINWSDNKDQLTVTSQEDVRKSQLDDYHDVSHILLTGRLTFTG